MKIHSTRFGELEVPEADIIRFPDGLPGFSGEKRFAYIPYQPDSPFAFLQSATEPDLTFLVVEPFTFFTEYTFELDDAAAAELRLDADNRPQIVNIVSLRDQPADMTVNLVAPVVINRRDRMARQVVLEKSPYSTRHRLFPHGLPQNGAAKGGK